MATNEQIQRNAQYLAARRRLVNEFGFTESEVDNCADPRLLALADTALQEGTWRQYVEKVNRGELRQPKAFDVEAFKASIRDERDVNRAADRLADALPSEKEDPRDVQARLGRQQGIVGF